MIYSKNLFISLNEFTDIKQTEIFEQINNFISLTLISEEMEHKNTYNLQYFFDNQVNIMNFFIPELENKGFKLIGKLNSLKELENDEGEIEDNIMCLFIILCLKILMILELLILETLLIIILYFI